MNHIISFKAIVIITLSFIAFSCSKNDDLNPLQPRTYNVGGKVEKGPFVSGSTITIQSMDSKLQVLGSMFNTTITDNTGNFTFGSKEFQTSYAEMMATGYFFNEVRGSLSDGVLVLRSLVDLTDHSSVNVNILTHLKYPRIKKLIESGKSFKEANTQAQKEILTAFGLQKYTDKDVSQYSIIAGTDESAALIAVSSLLLINRSEGELTEYLSTLSQEFSANGTFSDVTRAQMKKDKIDLENKLNDIQNNIIKRYSELEMSVTVKNLREFFDWDDDGIAGNETLKEGETVTLDKTQISVPKEGGTYTININSPIPVYTTPLVNGDEPPLSILKPETITLYAEDANSFATIASEIENKELTINVGKAKSRKEQTSVVNLYDCIGNVVASLNLTIAGDNMAKIPQLGGDAKTMVRSITSALATAYSKFNTIEQYYHYNKEINRLPLVSSDAIISDIWSNFWNANSMLLRLKEMDERQLDVYQDYCNVFYAIYYYSMIVGWGNVPYNNGSSWTIESMNMQRTDNQTIFTDLKTRLLSAIENLDEKRNNSINDQNNFFFVSKDVARIVLANIYMYEGDWASAKGLLAKVRSKGYYQLDGTDEYTKSSNGIIFALINESSTKSEEIKEPNCMPIQSITDVYLSSAECEYHLGNSTEANNLLKQVVAAKGITVTANGLPGIKDARTQLLLYNGNYFAFLKRNNLAIEECGIQDYQLLFPIPEREIVVNPSLIQNPGY